MVWTAYHQDRRERGRTAASLLGCCGLPGPRFLWAVFWRLLWQPPGGCYASIRKLEGCFARWRVFLWSPPFGSGGFLWQPFRSHNMEEAIELREAVVSAVCAKEYQRLPTLIQRLARQSPTEDTLLRSGIGHLVGDRHLWALAGPTTQRRAAALQARWRHAVRMARGSGTATPRAPPKPFNGLRAKDFLALVKDFERVLARSLPEHSAPLRRAVAVKIVLMGFTSMDQISCTQEDDVKEFISSPAQRGAFLQAVRHVDAGLKKRRQDQESVLEHSSAISSSSSSQVTAPGEVRTLAPGNAEAR